jgi:hypothetical protein
MRRVVPRDGVGQATQNGFAVFVQKACFGVIKRF